MTTNLDKYRDDLQNHAQKVVQILEEFKNLSTNIDLEDKELKKSIGNINSIIYKGISRLRRSIDFYIKNTDWDTLHIAFFGETNAGKSTLIEALVKGDGRSIGEGYKDYTKYLRKVSFIDNIYFLDMPGIEGKEGKLLNEIKKAVEKAHVIFYVIGTNKEPEEGTLKKVKYYLKDRAKVYSILNVRGKPTAYKYKKALTDENISKVEERIKLRFKNILKEHYRGNITINAYLGYLSVSKPVREDLVIDKRKVLKVFDSFEKAYDFSNLNKVKKLILELSKQSRKEIIVSNTYKFLKTLEIIVSKILKEKKKFDYSIKETREQAEEYLNTAKGTTMKYQNKILSVVQSDIDTMEKDLIDDVYKGIDNEWSEKDLQKKISEIQNKYENRLNEKVNYLLEEMKKEIKDNFDEFKERININLKFKDLKGDIDIKRIIGKLEVSYKYVIEQIGDIGLSIWTVVELYAINPILGVIAAVISALKKIWEWFFETPEKRKRQAKEKARSEIKESIQELKRKFTKRTNSKIKELKNNVETQIKEMNLYLEGLKRFSISMSEKIKELNDVRVRISTLLTKYILGNGVELSYIDLQLDRAIIFGNSFSKTDMEILRIKNISYYKSLEDFLKNINHTIEYKGEIYKHYTTDVSTSEVTIVPSRAYKILVLHEEDEFVYRTLALFSDKLNLNGIRRKKK